MTPATTPVTVTSVTTGTGPVVIGTQGDMLVDSGECGSASVTLSSAAGGILDGRTGGSSASHTNVMAGSLVLTAATNSGNGGDALWVNATSIEAAAPGGGVWINDAATTPVTVTSVTAGAGPIVIGAQGNLLVDSVNAGSASATLSSATGSVLNGVEGGSSASQPNVMPVLSQSTRRRMRGMRALHFG